MSGLSAKKVTVEGGGMSGRSLTARALMLEEVAASQRQTSVRLSPDFVRGLEEAPPLARLAVGGQGGEVRLKLFLTFAMRAASPPFTLDGQTNDALASLLGLPQPGGERRVASALRWLEAHGYIVRTARTGEAPEIELRHADTGTPWTDRDSEGRYARVPLALWTQGWVHALTGRALAVYVCLVDLTNGGKKAESMSGYRKAQYGLSPDTWTRALRELSGAGLISISTKIEGSGSRMRRRRNVYRLTADDKIPAAPST